MSEQHERLVERWYAFELDGTDVAVFHYTDGTVERVETPSQPARPFTGWGDGWGELGYTTDGES
jgi:hypothetical protein